jgi:cytochrome c
MSKLICGILFFIFLSSCNNKKSNPSNDGFDETEVESNQEVKNEFQKGADLIDESDCLACHKIDEKLVGPSYKDIAIKYSDKDIETLTKSIIEGGSGKWGEVPMPAHLNLSKDDAEEMVKYILTLR